jgi:hypothetical protein
MSSVSTQDSRQDSWRARAESIRNKLDRFVHATAGKLGSLAKRVEEYFGSLLRRKPRGSEPTR